MFKRIGPNQSNSIFLEFLGVGLVWVYSIVRVFGLEESTI